MKTPRHFVGAFLFVGLLDLRCPCRPLREQARSHMDQCRSQSSVGASLLAKAFCQAPLATEACAVRNSCRLPRNSTNVAINPNTAAPLSQIPGAALLSSTWIR